MYVNVYVSIYVCTYTYFASHSAQKKNGPSFPILHSGQKSAMIVSIINCRQTATSPPYFSSFHSRPVIIAITNCNVNFHDPGLPSFMQVDIGLFIFAFTWDFPSNHTFPSPPQNLSALAPLPLPHISKSNEPCLTKKICPHLMIKKGCMKHRKEKRLAVANGCRLHAAL